MIGMKGLGETGGKFHGLAAFCHLLPLSPTFAPESVARKLLI